MCYILLQIIPARGFSNVNITFTPLSTDHVTQEMDCVGFAIAHMSIDKVRVTQNPPIRTLDILDTLF